MMVYTSSTFGAATIPTADRGMAGSAGGCVVSALVWRTTPLS